MNRSEEFRDLPGNILDCLENTEERFRYKTAVEDDKLTLTYHELMVMARRIGSGILRRTRPGMPVPVLMEKSPVTLAVMLGAVYAGCFYVPVNPSNPAERLRKIFRTLDSPIVVTDEAGQRILREVEEHGEMLTAEELLCEDVDIIRLEQIREAGSETDILYALFTSGSTGTPKAVAVSHGAVIRFIGHFTEIFGITEKDNIGNQAPFDFDVSVKDIYSAIMTGASLTLIPKEYFSTPPRLLDYICGKKVTTLIWAVSALTLVSALKGLDYRVPEEVNKVMFSGEAMPPKQLRIWQEALPDASFVNLYGPTEITCNCTYYRVERELEMGETLPIGRPFPNEAVFLLDEEDREVTEPGRKGEICVAGTALALGYYNNREQTEKVFVQNPLNPGYPERIYRTGDLGYYGEDGELYFASRKDFQIKHMGHRIELGEIEAAMEQIPGIGRSCCIFDKEKNRIEAFYEGNLEKRQIKKLLGTRLPAFMLPNGLYRVDCFPLTKNGKTDRKRLEQMVKEGSV